MKVNKWRRPWLSPLLAFGLAAACADTKEQATAPAPDPLAHGWPVSIVSNPTLFVDLTQGGARDGWIAFHKSHPSTAIEHLDGIGKARAHLELAYFYGDLARITHFSWEKTFTTWEEKSGFSDGSAIPLVAALAAWDAGDEDRATKWLAKANGTQNPQFNKLGQDLSKGLQVTTAKGHAAECVNAHITARSTGVLSGIDGCISTPLFVDQNAGQNKTKLYDPLIYTTLSMGHLKAAKAALGDSPMYPENNDSALLSGLLFSGFWSREDALSAHASTAGSDNADGASQEGDQPEGPASEDTNGVVAIGPTLTGLGFADDSPESDDAQWARERVRKLDVALDGWRNQMLESVSAGGIELIENLDLVGVYRSQVLLAWARHALSIEKPAQALAYAQMAMDVEHGREIGPRNRSGLFAVTAEAHLKTGHTREALDALQILSEHYPSVEGIDETTGDLAILQGFGRQGDSKEN